VAVTALERLGLEVCAYTLLGSRGRSSLLMALVDGGGAAVSYDALREARAWKMPHHEDAGGHKGVQVRMVRLRDAMDDVGLGGLIVTHPGGYALPEPGRSRVIQRLTEEAAA
jgi:F420-0:gamma-glutamyl ligase-like protein